MSHSTDNVLRTLYTTVFSQKFSPDGLINYVKNRFSKIYNYKFLLISWRRNSCSQWQLRKHITIQASLHNYIKSIYLRSFFIHATFFFSFRLSNALSTESIDRIKLPFSKIKGKNWTLDFLLLLTWCCKNFSAHRSSLYSLESSNEYLIW